MPEASNLGPVGTLPFIHIDEHARVSLQGSRCSACEAVLLGTYRACSSCGARGTLVAIELSNRGKLYSYTIVGRTFPGVTTPFVAAVVDLEGGGTLKGTLLHVAPEPAALPFDMPVEVIFRDSGQRDPMGRPFITYYFTPCGALQ